jgi:RNA polymerase sigma factor (sigma-70 family)
MRFLRSLPAAPGLLVRSRGSPRTFAEFYEERAENVLRYFWRETRNEQVALDLTAETFAVAFEKRRDFRGASDEQASAWLWKIAHSQLSHFVRDRKVELAALRRVGFERPIATDDETLEIELLAARQDVNSHLTAAIRKLPAEQQEVIHLRFSRELTYPQIAQELGVTDDVARSRGSRALRTLRENHHMREISALRQT